MKFEEKNYPVYSKFFRDGAGNRWTWVECTFPPPPGVLKGESLLRHNAFVMLNS